HKISGITANLLADVGFTDAPMNLSGTTDLLGQYSATCLLLLQEGHVNCHMHGKLICRYEPGDLLGLGRSLSLPGGQLSTDDSIVVQPLERDLLIEHISTDPGLLKLWSYFLIAHLSWHQQALAQEIRS